MLCYMWECFSFQALKQDLASVHKKNVQLKLQSQKAEAELKTLIEAVQR